MCLLSESAVAFGPSLLQHGEDSSVKHNRRASLQVKGSKQSILAAGAAKIDVPNPSTSIRSSRGDIAIDIRDNGCHGAIENTIR